MHTLRQSLGVVVSTIARCPPEWLELYDKPGELDDASAGSTQPAIEAEEEIRCARRAYEALSPAFEYLREKLLTLLRDPKGGSCDFDYSKNLILGSLWKLFDSKTRLEPVIKTDPWKISSTGLAGVDACFASVDTHLGTIEAALSLIYSSVSADVFMENLRLDSLLIASAPASHFKTKAGRTISGFSLASPPRVLSELLGYATARVESTEAWSSVSLHERSALPTLLISRLAEDDGIAPKKGFRLWETLAALASNWPARLGAIDVHATLVEALYNQSVPSPIAKEAAVSRYLVESGVVQALHQAYFEVLMQPDRLMPYTTICTSLFPMSARLHTFRLSSQQLLAMLQQYAGSCQHQVRPLYTHCAPTVLT